MPCLYNSLPFGYEFCHTSLLCHTWQSDSTFFSLGTDIRTGAHGMLQQRIAASTFSM